MSGEISLPAVRTELLAYLAEARDAALYKNTPAVEFLVHFIFDDHDFGVDAEAEIGRTLVDSHEAEAIRRFSSALDTAIGRHDRPLSAVSAEDWRPVARAAEEALAVLTAGRPE